MKKIITHDIDKDSHSAIITKKQTPKEKHMKKIAQTILTLFLVGGLLAACSTNPQLNSLTIDQENPQTVNVGEALQLTATIRTIGTLDEALTWTSSNPSVATVDATGLVAGLRGGTTTIRVESVFDSAVFDTIVINVPAVTGIVIDEDSPERMNVNTQLQLNAIVETLGEAATDVVWQSENPYVATIDENGLVTAHNGGTVVITATSTVNPRMIDGIIILVQDVMNIEIENVSPTSVLLSETEQLTLDITATPEADTSVTYQSSNTAVATIDEEGLIQPLAGGSTLITVTSTLNPNTNASLLVYVPEVLDVTISPNDRYVMVLGETINLQAIVETLGNAPETVTWESDIDTYVSLTDQGVLSAQTPGVTTITATSTFDPSQTDQLILVTISPTE